MRTYDVGDVIWVVGTERPGLRVLQVIEEVTKKTLKGELTTYMVALPVKPGSPSKPINLEKIPGDIFTSADDAKGAMLLNAEQAIGKMFEHSQKLVDSCFVSQSMEDKDQVHPILESIPQSDDPSIETIRLENGQLAHVKIPEGL